MSPSVGSETLKNNNRLQVDNEIEHDQFEVSIETSKSSYANAVFKSFTGFAKDMKVLYKEKVFVVNVLGNVFLLPLFLFFCLHYVSFLIDDTCTCL
jgi:predicted PurR-regulated permease PerM